MVKVRQSGFGGPGADLVERLGFEQPVGDEDFHQIAQRHIAFPRHNGLNDASQTQAAEELGEDGQGTHSLGLEVRKSRHGKTLRGMRHAEQEYTIGEPRAARAMPEGRRKLDEAYAEREWSSWSCWLAGGA